MALRLRQARRDEVAALSALARAAKASWGYPASWMEAWRATLTFPAEDLDRHAVVMAEVEGAPVGVVALEDGEEEAELHHLWVHPTAQGTGGSVRCRLPWPVRTAPSRCCAFP